MGQDGGASCRLRYLDAVIVLKRLRTIKYFLIKKLAHYYFFRIGKLRSKLYTMLMAEAGKDIYIFPPFFCPSPEGIRIGSNINISQNCHIGGQGGVTIGNFVMIGPNSVIASSNHGFSRGDIPMVRQKPVPSPITIEDDVWLGANVVVLPGVTIRQGAIVGSGAVVSEDVPAYAIVVGNPARIIRKRFGESQIEELLSKDSPLFRYYGNDYLETSTPTLHFDH